MRTPSEVFSAITVSGVVVDKAGKGVAGALVRLGKAGLFIQSSSEGKFTLSNVITDTRQQITKSTSTYNYNVAADSRTLTFDLPVQSLAGIMVYGLTSHS